MDSSQKFKYGLTLENLYLNKLNDKTVTSVKKKKKKKPWRTLIIFITLRRKTPNIKNRRRFIYSNKE